MHRSWGLLLCLALGCDDVGPDTERTTNTNNAFSTPPPIGDDELEDNSAHGAPDDGRWTACGQGGGCPLHEQCIRGAPENFSICLAACTTVDDCGELSNEARAGFSAFVTCSPFFGAARCILACQSAAECMPGMTCIEGGCVWP